MNWSEQRLILMIVELCDKFDVTYADSGFSDWTERIEKKKIVCNHFHEHRPASAITSEPVPAFLKLVVIYILT